MQAQLMQFGLVKPQHAYATFKKGCEVIGFENPSEFAMDPNTPEYKAMIASQPPPPPDPKVQVAQITAQSAQAKEQSQTQRALLQAKVDLTNAQTDRVHEQTLEDQRTAHDTLQQHQDRQTDAAGHDKDIAMTLIKVMGQIVASQLKQNASADAGAVVKKDLGEVNVSV